MKCILCNNSTFEIIRKKIRHEIPIKVVKCKKCALISLENPSKNIIDYSEPGYRGKYTSVLGKTLSPKEFFDLEIQFQPARVNRVNKLLQKKHKVLEIGSSTGHFLYSIKDKVGEAIGIELDHKYANFSRKHCNLKIFEEPIKDVKLPDNYFDVIFMFQVFEHIQDPLDFLKHCKRILKPHGKIYLEVPNVDDALLRIFNIPAFVERYYRAPHTYYYSTNTLNKLLTKAGVKGKTLTSQDYTIFNHMHWITTNSPQSSQEYAYNIPDFTVTEKKFKEIEKMIKEFFISTNKKYMKILEKNKISENICYLGKLE